MSDAHGDPTLAALGDLSRKIAGGQALHETLAAILETAAGLTGASRGLLLARPSPGAALLEKAAMTMTAGDLDLPEMQAGNWLVRTALHGGEAIISNLDGSHGSAPTAGLAAPLRVADRVKGVLYLDRPAPYFTPRDLEIAAILASQAALVMEAGEARAALLSANETHGRLISTITHELRLPMTSIKGYADILRQGMAGALNEQQLSFLNTIRNNVERMSALVSDISDTSRISSGRLVLGMAAVPLKSSLDEAIHSLQARITEKETAIHMDIPDGLPTLHADPKRLVQVLVTLLGNAIRYGPRAGQVRVSARTENGRVRVQVSDSGIGISEADQARLFEAFFRSDDPRVREFPGWGLALHVARGLVNAMGGETGCTSQLNQGSDFWFDLPQVNETSQP